MKLKMNKACDLNSISVLPPHTRRSSMIMAQQSRSQPSQQSFSQGVSSQQNAVLSQLSQNALDEMLTDNQRFGSQDKDNSVKRVSCLVPASYPREETQLPMSMSSANLTRRWSSTSLPDQKCQSVELEHKLATMETLISRFGMVLDSVQADIMQVNKGTKELSLSVEGIRQKSIAQDDSLHILRRGQEEIKNSLGEGLRSISNQLSRITQQEKMQEMMSKVMTLLEQIEANGRGQTEELSKCFSGDLQTIICSLKTLNQKHLPLANLPPKVTGGDSSSQRPLFRREPESLNISKRGYLAPKVEQGWTTVKAEQGALSNQYGNSCRNLLQRRFTPLARQHKIVFNLDEESDDEDFSCFVIGNDPPEARLPHNSVNCITFPGNADNHRVDEEANRILKKARRKRKQSCKR